MTRRLESGIHKRADGRYGIVIELPTKAGKRRRKWATAPTYAAARERKAKLLAELQRNGDLASNVTTVASWLKTWSETIAPASIRPKTLTGYQTVIDKHIVPAIGGKRLSKLRPDDIRELHRIMVEKPRNAEKPDGPKLSPTYALLAHRVLSRALKIAEREGHIGRNPCELVDPPRKTKPELDALTVEEAIAVLRKAAAAIDAPGEYDPLPAMWATFLLTGGRRGEIIGLEQNRVGSYLDFAWQLQRIPDVSTAPVDFEHRTVRGLLYLTRPKSAAGVRVVPLVEPLKTMLAMHMERAGQNAKGLVFTAPEGGPLDPDNVSKAWIRWIAASGITDKKVRLHDLRHTTVDLLYEAGVPEDVIVEIVGHSTRSMTRAYKTRGSDKRLVSAMESLSAILA